MSRHRFVRNININEELEDDAISDGGEDDLSPEDYERMMDGLEHIRATLGDERHTALTDQDIKDSLYEYYFDVEQAIADLLEKQERKFAARERQDPNGKPLPPPPLDEDGDWSSTTDTSSGRHNVPFVRLTPSDYFSSSDQETTQASVRPGTLYTIQELTELSEDSRDWASPADQQQQPLPPDPYLQAGGGSRATLISSVTTDYGQIIDRSSWNPEPVSVSPSPSALQRLSYQEPAGSATPGTPSPSVEALPVPSLGEAPIIDNMPDIPDFKSKSSLQRPRDPSQASLLSKKSARTAENSGSEKKSKLSALASSRSSARSSMSSVSIHSYTTETASDVTYPALRPSAASMVSLLPEKRLPSRPSSISEHSESSSRSSMSRIVKDALQSALALEAMEREPPTPKEPTHLSMPTSRSLSERSSTSSNTASASPTPIPFRTSTHLPPIPPLPPPSHGSAPQLVPPPPVSGQPRQLSKLARLAQAKAQEQTQAKSKDLSKPGLILPRPHTEYLIPTANGATATTAITTSYQSLGSLLPRNESKLPPSMSYQITPTPKAHPVSLKSSGSKPSKLAMKSKSARSKVGLEPEFEPSINPVLDVPIFSPKITRSRALPSAFASLLVNDTLGPHEADDVDHTHRHRRHRSDQEHKRRKERGDEEKARRHRNRERDVLPLPPAPLPNLRGFTFDVPSPDDIIFNARRGTSLAQSSTSSTQSLSVASSR
ncbi:hypothetical protein C8Q79DRAFT_1006444 [Trametes meyenii]|nr:hypothetical protein C8Q79DRAFT_1006444 [Trametes meyenii]